MTTHSDPHPVPAIQVQEGDQVLTPSGWLTVVAPSWTGGDHGDVVLDFGQGRRALCQPGEPIVVRRPTDPSQAA